MLDSQPPQLNISREIVRLAERARVIRRATAVSRVGATFIVVCVVCAGLDAFLRFPSFLRGIMLVSIACLLIIDWWRIIIPAFRFRPTAVDVALRIERLRPELTGRLASAVEFELSGKSAASALASRSVADAEERLSGADVGRVLRYRPVVLRTLWLALLIFGGTVFTANDSSTALVACKRLFTPWSDAAWPSRSGVESLVVDRSVAARGRPFALRARLTAGDPEQERVRAEYRLTRDGISGEWMEVILARQPSEEFERLVDADGEQIEFRFLTSDAATQTASVRLVDPPAVVECVLEISPPQYANRVIKERVEQLGNGRDGQSIVDDPILVGSLITLKLRLTRAVPLDATHSTVRFTSAALHDAESSLDTSGEVIVSTSSNDQISPGESTTSQAGRNELSPSPRLSIDSTDPALWTVTCVAKQSTSVSIELIDADGIHQSEPTAFAFETIEDRPPSAAVLEPPQDDSIVMDAKIPMRAQARDDLEIRGAGMEIATRLGSAGDESLVFEAPAKILSGSSAADAEEILDVGRLNLSAGDSLTLRGYAEDFFEALPVDDTGLTPPTVFAHVRVKSAPRILRIVAEEEFERQIRATFSGVRRDAMRLDDRQSKARDALAQDAADPALAEAQGAITEGIARARESIEQAVSRLKRNGREAGALADLARQAAELTDAAQAKSSEVSDALSELALAEKGADAAAKEASAKEAASRQGEVREELEDLVALLDRDEDAWIAQRRIDALANRVRQLARETDQAAKRSSGETREELSPEARAELDALGDKQTQAAKDAEKVAAELHERAKSLAEADPKQAKALEEAAKAIEQGRVREELEDAAKDASENRLEQSKEAQDRAAEALVKAAAALEEDHKVRAEELARLLETLVDSIKRLLSEAETLAAEVQTVSDMNTDAGEIARESTAFPIGKLSQNTRGVASDARAASREAARVARVIDSAAGSLAGATGMLRASQFKRGDASAAMDAAIKSFNDALVEAEDAADRAEERAEEEKREEILARYRELLELQAAVRASTMKIIAPEGKALARRELMESRRLGTVQEQLRGAIESIRSSETDVQNSDALIEMHDTIDDVLLDAKARLSDGDPDGALPAEDEAIAALAAIVEALDEDKSDDESDPFGEQEAPQGEGGAGGGGPPPAGAIPPVAEIKILRSMQRSLAQRTRAFAEQSAVLDPVARAQQVANLAAKQQRIVELGQKIADKIAPSGNPTFVPAREGVKPEPSEAPESLEPTPPQPTEPPKREGEGGSVNSASVAAGFVPNNFTRGTTRISVGAQWLSKNHEETPVKHQDFAFESQSNRREVLR